MVSVLCFLEVVDSVLFVVNEVLVIMYKVESDDLYIIAVTPLVGVWIEMWQHSQVARRQTGHSPCGSVDFNLAFQKFT